MDTIVLPISFHTCRTIPLSDLCKTIKYLQLRITKYELVHIEYEISNEKEILQTGTAILTPAMSTIPLSPIVKDPSNSYTVLRINAMSPRPPTEAPYELRLVIVVGKN